MTHPTPAPLTADEIAFTQEMIKSEMLYQSKFERRGEGVLKRAAESITALIAEIATMRSMLGEAQADANEGWREARLLQSNFATEQQARKAQAVEIERLQNGLLFYANLENWDNYLDSVACDSGHVARVTLEKNP